MKRFISAIAIAIITTAAAFSQESKFSLGITGGIGTEFEERPYFGFSLHYTLNDRLRLAPEFGVALMNFDYVTKKENWTSFQGNINLHYLFNFNKLSVYPLVGITAMNWNDRAYNYYNPYGSSNSTAKKSVARIGANAGAGLQYNFPCKIYVNAEGKYSSLWRTKKDFIGYSGGTPQRMNNFMITAGIGYNF
ncbi:MAG: outer membrane protein [Dysgonomonas sp.]